MGNKSVAPKPIRPKGDTEAEMNMRWNCLNLAKEVAGSVEQIVPFAQQFEAFCKGDLPYEQGPAGPPVPVEQLVQVRELSLDVEDEPGEWKAGDENDPALAPVE